MGKFCTNDHIHECIIKLEQVESALRDTYTLAINLEKRVQGMKWSGEHRDHFLTLLNMVVQYHGDVKGSASEVCTVMKGLQADFDGFETMSSVIKLKGIGE